MARDEVFELWIEVVGWDRFQHYKHRDPPWVKNYLRLLSDDAYLGLTQHRALVLHRLWLAYAASGQELRVHTATLSRLLHVRVSNSDLQSLNHAGFIRFVASKPLATRAHATETELFRKEESSNETRNVGTTRPNAAAYQQRNGPADPPPNAELGLTAIRQITEAALASAQPHPGGPMNTTETPTPQPPPEPEPTPDDDTPDDD